MLCSDGALAQAAQRLWGLLLGDLPELPGRGPGHPALGVPAGAGVGPDGHRGHCQPQPCCGSVTGQCTGLCCTAQCCTVFSGHTSIKILLLI